MKKLFKLLAVSMMLAVLFTMASSAYILIDNCDTYQHDDTPEWVGTFADLSTDNPPEGTGYIYAPYSGGLMILAKSFKDPFDLSEYTDGYFILDIYVEDVSSISSGYIEMYTDNQTTGWNILEYVTENGWNKVAVKMSEGTPLSGGGFDCAEFTSTRIFAYTNNAENVLAVDNLGIGMSPDKIDVVVDNCDLLAEESDFMGNSWAAEGVATVEELGEDAVKEGSGSIYEIDKATVIVGVELEEAIDLTAFDPEDTYLTFWFYISDAYGTNLAGNVELGSTGLSLEESSRWSMTELSYMQDGWNPVALRIADLLPNQVAVDLSHVDAFRIFDFVVSGEEVEFRVDRLGFASYAEAVELGFIESEEITEEVTEEVTEETTEEVTEEATEEVTEEVTEEATEEATEEVTEDLVAPIEEDSNTGLIIGIAIAAVVIVVAIIAFVVKKKK